MAVYIPILEYHDIAKQDGGGKTFHSPYVLDLEKFQSHMQWLHEHNFTTITIDDLFGAEINERSVIITFDDGHVSNYDKAVPLLRQFNFKATFFLVAHFVGQKDYLSARQIGEMGDCGMCFGSHSLTHPYLITLDGKDRAFEINKSKIVLERIVGRKINHFCIPYGFYNREIVREIEAAGYKSAVTERMGYFSPDEKPFKILPRFTIKASIRQNDFVSIMCRNWVHMAPRYIVEGSLLGVKKILGFNRYMRFKSMLVGTTGGKQNIT